MSPLTILISGASGFIGSALCKKLSESHQVVGLGSKQSCPEELSIIYEQADIKDGHRLYWICEKYRPDVVIHCAGIAHQKFGSVNLQTYLEVNTEGTEKLAKIAARYNPEIYFIFLSSVSVYGENQKIAIGREDTDVSNKRNVQCFSEKDNCLPTSHYATSKLMAEKKILQLYKDKSLNHLSILRLAPVYDRDWRLNLEKRVLSPGRIFFLKFGKGRQLMSALSRPNLVDFIVFLINQFYFSGKCSYHKSSDRILSPHKIDCACGIIDAIQINDRIINVCDNNPYEFRSIIQVLKQSGLYPKRLTVACPVVLIWLFTRVLALLSAKDKIFYYSCYDKLTNDLVFENKRMLGTGYSPSHNLESVFNKG